ncbi:MAG: right-handed parallel beta-helix repeat-containing protein [Myxococcales bacterium]|nr:right-handed parallel beta-helix repeat-containing protein [Myxococcales bacterium]
MWWSSMAVAATLRVGAGQPYATIQDAVDVAAPGDVVEVHAGVYAEAVRVTLDLEIVGVGSPVLQALPRPSIPLTIAGADVTVRDLVVQGDSSNPCISADSFGRPRVVLDGLDVSGCRVGVDVDGTARVTIRRSTFTDDGWAVHAAAGTALTVRTSSFQGNGVAVWTEDADVQLVANRIEANGVGAWYPAAGPAVQIDPPTGNGVLLFGNRVCANPAGGAMVYDVPYARASRVVVSNNLFQENGGPMVWEGGGLWAEGTGYGFDLVLTQNAFIGNEAATGSQLYASAAVQAIVTSTLFAYGRGGVALYESPFSGDVVGSYDAFFDNQPSTLSAQIPPADLAQGSLIGDPLFTSLSLDGDCTNDDLTPLPGSPLIDAGDPADIDPDGTRADIGWIW